MKLLLSALLLISLLTGPGLHAAPPQVKINNHPVQGPPPGRGTVQGTVLLSNNNIAQELQDASGSKMRIEVWRVNYAADQTTRSNTDIYLQQKINVPVSVQTDQTGIHYTIQNMPSLSNLVVIAYAAGAGTGNDLRVTGKPFDGQPAAPMHQFKSDAKKYLGANIVYGIYSLKGQMDNYTNVDFHVSPLATAKCTHCSLDLFGDIENAVSDIADAVTKTINGVVHVFDQTINGVAGLAKCAINDIQGIVDVTNFYINQAGLIFYLTAAGLINLIEYGNFPRVRNMTTEEYAWANAKVFNNTLPPRENILIFNFMNLEGDHHRCFTWPAPTGNFIYVNIGDAFDNPMTYTNTGYPAPGQVFIHELTHTWQCNRWGLPGMVARYFSAPGGLDQSYDPGCAFNNINSNYNLEQQATMVDRSYANIYFAGLNENFTCNYGVSWVEKNIRNGVPFDRNLTESAKEMAKVAGVVGGMADGQTFHSNGNKMDGDGYFMLGRNNNSFLYYSNKTKIASGNWGVIRDRFRQANYEFGELGWPARSEALLPDAIGYYQKFDHGFIYWNPKYGAYVILNNIFDPWAKDGWEKGKLGYPVSDYIAETASAGYQKFAGGIIFYSQTTGQPSINIRYGNPAAILAEYHQSVNSMKERVMINPQPLPPGARKKS